MTDGVELARKYRIPTEVAEGIVTHHGDGIMRYFYEKARQADGDEEVDPNDFRHIGHKPRTAEMAIVMLADSLEAACRAVFRDEEPTAEAIDKVVNRVVDEKVNDGQLSESALTLAQLTKPAGRFSKPWSVTITSGSRIRTSRELEVMVERAWSDERSVVRGGPRAITPPGRAVLSAEGCPSN